MHGVALLSRKWHICLLMGSSEGIPLFLCLCTQLLFLLLNWLYSYPWVFLSSLYSLLDLQDRGVSEKLGGCLAVGWSQPTTASVYTLLIFKPVANLNGYVAIKGEVVSHFHLHQWHMVYIFPAWATFIFM